MKMEYKPISETSCIFNTSLLTNSVNFHGPGLLKLLISKSANLARNLHSINLQNIDYIIYENRLNEIRRAGSRVEDIVQFIAAKSDFILGCNVDKEIEKGSNLIQNYKDYYEHLLPLEYLMKTSIVDRYDAFTKTVEEGDIIIVTVMNATSVNILNGQCLQFISFDAGKHRYLRDSQHISKIILLSKDTEVPKADEDGYQKWMTGTRLRVEVLAVNISNETTCCTLHVGTKGVTLGECNKDVMLGKVTVTDIPSILRVTPDPTIHFVSECIEKMDEYKNPQCIKSMAKDAGIDLYNYSSMMTSASGAVLDNEKAITLRKAQMSKWAHKSVADGVTYFKNGQTHEAFQCLNKALQIDPENVEALVAKGALLANLGKYGKSIEEFERSLKFNPKHVNARKYMCETLVELAKQFEEKDNLKDAEKNYLRCLELNENHEVALEALTVVCKKLGDTTSLMRFKKEESIKEHNEATNIISDLMEIQNDLIENRKIQENKCCFDVYEEQSISTVVKRNPLSPLSRKMALHQETQSIQSGILPYTNNLIPPPGFNYFSNPTPHWVNSELSNPNHDAERNVHDDYEKKVSEFLKEMQQRPNASRRIRNSKSRSRSPVRRKYHKSNAQRTNSRHSKSRSRKSVRNTSKDRTSISRERINSYRKEIKKFNREETRSITRDRSRSISCDRSRSMIRNQSRSVSRKQSRSISRNRSRNASRNRSNSVSRNRSKSVSKNRSRSVSKNRSNSEDKNLSRSEDRNLSRSEDRNLSRSASRNRSRSISRDRSRSIRREKRGNKRSRSQSGYRTRSLSRSKNRKIKSRKLSNDRGKYKFKSGPRSKNSSTCSSSSYSNNPKNRKKKAKKKRTSKRDDHKMKEDQVSDLSVPDFKDLEEKLQAYYKKIEHIQSPDSSASVSKNRKMMKTSKQGQLTKKDSKAKKEVTKGIAMNIHPAFLNNDSSENETDSKKKSLSQSVSSSSTSSSSGSCSSSSYSSGRKSKKSSRNRSGRTPDYKRSVIRKDRKRYRSRSPSSLYRPSSPTPVGYYNNKPFAPSYDSNNATSAGGINKKRIPIVLKSAKAQIESYLISGTTVNSRSTKVNEITNSKSSDTTRFGKWSTITGKDVTTKVTTSSVARLNQFERFIEVAKQEKLEKMKERNKSFLKPPV